jgi:hypothetical protein
MNVSQSGYAWLTDRRRRVTLTDIRPFRLRRHRRVVETEWQAGHAAWLLDLAGQPEDAPKIARDYPRQAVLPRAG